MNWANSAENMDLEETDSLNLGVLADLVGPRIRILWNTLSARMEEQLAPFGLHTGAFSSMALISANPGLSQNEIAKGLGMDKSAVVAIIDELETKGLAKRARQTIDRRRYSLKLTPKGQALLQKMLIPARIGSQPIRDSLSRRDHDELLSLLDRACLAMAQSKIENRS